jgi:hypothetical protein
MRLRKYCVKFRARKADANGQWFWIQLRESSVKEAAPIPKAIAPLIKTDQRCDDHVGHHYLPIRGIRDVPKASCEANSRTPLAKHERPSERHCDR